METGQQGVAARRELKHVTIREYVRNLALASAPGAPAPSERELVDRFGVARMTVRQALDALVVEGVLERFPGRGTFVARPRRVPTGISSFTEDMQRRAVVAESRTLIADRVGAANGVARALGIGVRQPVLHWRRLRLADGRPVCLSDAFLNDTLVPNLFDGELPASLYDELASRGRRPTWAEDSVSAGTATAEESELLEIDASSVVIRHNRRALWEDIPIEVTRSVYPADQHTLWLQFGD
ncbi:GntR family transcriptional regulator [Nocardioides thalensis]|uniref:GntR family transcriptional regulator n=1 Tax=Nocardioides thalensis TaxID=1914755 RepID=A0A853C7X9_9ACTN|nr:GntR family transcriptional regulator [Nocardioides thalensis]